MYIALDIETTGFNYERDEIIEIGATKFDDTQILDKFQTFVKATKSIPPLITHITGIKDNDLEGAPQIEDIQEELMDFVGDDPIVGHNISFDLDFLKTKGVVLENARYDTLPISMMMIPGLPSYSLEMITKHLEIGHKAKHRALDDAVASAELFQILNNRIKKIDHDTLEEIKVILERSDWALKDVFLQVQSENHTPSAHKGNGIIADTAELPFDKDKILSFYDEGGPLSKCENDYEVRQPQLEMTKRIMDAFKEGYHLLCEAGTGTGKSIAYLLPSIFRSRHDNEKVVISTHTKNLQDQLYNKDVPVLQKAVNEFLGKQDSEMPPFAATVLKGRRNYLSGKRLDQFKQKSHFQDHEITLLIKILLWLPTTHAGELEELSLQGKEYYAWKEVCCDAIKCPHHDPLFNSKCFLSLARERAQEADIIITNHALLLSDAIATHKVLPDYNYLVVDEAHHIENETTKAMTIHIAADIIEHPVITLKNLLRKHPEISGELDAFMQKINIFFGLLGIFFEKNIEYANSIRNMPLNEAFKGTYEWEKVSASAENICLQGTKILKELVEYLDEDERLGQECSALQEQLDNMSMIVLGKSEEEISQRITWLDQHFDESVGIKSTPLNVGNELQSTLFKEKQSIIMTSATLTVNHSFDYIRSQLALGEHFEECILPSHFSYPDQVKVIVYDNMKTPATPGYFDQTCEIIKKTALENGGKMLVLFTSKKAIEATYLKLAPILKEKGITILAQNVSGGRNKIIELFKQDSDNSVIFGTNSFWEGVDIKGSALDCVMIQKLPFDPPDDPIHSARGSLYNNSFSEYQIPRAILRFKQGFGRLIRSSKDSGKVIIMDSRVFTKSYGRIFIDSLPEGIQIKRLSV